ncbi:M50 family metallopeptidase [Natronolimnobius sp. AArcel1]|uniref:M50 family metallopeptidase n=1 Tax=Natronolimnobius sp. AArcel1 TaxID=1679093 RepID=UPI0013EA0FB7|nr:M50 family metallopeptidase [Natronolimnobius sp. AArcel1]NGM68096.1 M50 family metallopeptidase [Natronolimnobius sp. AArcel1]
MCAARDTDDRTLDLEALFREPFGFTWGETDGTTWLRTDEGSYKRVHPVFFEQLREIATGSSDPTDHDERVRETVVLLASEGYLEPGGEIVHEQPPPDIRLWPRLGAVAATATLLVGCLAVRWPELRQLPADLEFGLGLALIVLPILLGSIALHELGHYVPSRRYFDPQLRIGLLNKVIPAIITRTTDAWRCPRNVRLWISLAGPFVDLLVATGFAVAFVIVPGQPIFGFLALLIAARALFVLNPLIEGDGYWALVDAFGWHNLRTQGFRDLEHRILSGPAVYALSAVIFTIGFVGLNIAILATVFGLV